MEALKAIHARQGFGYRFPDLGNPLFLTKLVLGREEGGKGIVGASLLRLTAEAYLLLDPRRKVRRGNAGSGCWACMRRRDAMPWRADWKMYTHGCRRRSAKNSANG